MVSSITGGREGEEGENSHRDLSRLSRPKKSGVVAMGVNSSTGSILESLRYYVHGTDAEIDNEAAILFRVLLVSSRLVVMIRRLLSSASLENNSDVDPQVTIILSNLFYRRRNRDRSIAN